MVYLQPETLVGTAYGSAAYGSAAYGSAAYGSAVHDTAHSVVGYGPPSLLWRAAVAAGSIVAGCGLAFAAISWMQRNMAEDTASEDPRVEERKQIREYEQKYIDELSALPEEELGREALTELGKLQVREKTPFGEVVMTYNPDAECFWYYSDGRNIPYRTLDAVARYFAVSYECKAICANVKEEVAAARRECEAQATKDAEDAKAEETDGERQRSVFATFKPRQSGRKGKKYPLLLKRSNKFCRKGALKAAPKGGPFGDGDSARDGDSALGNGSEELTFAQYKALQEKAKAE